MNLFEYSEYADLIKQYNIIRDEYQKYALLLSCKRASVLNKKLYNLTNEILKYKRSKL